MYSHVTVFRLVFIVVATIYFHKVHFSRAAISLKPNTRNKSLDTLSYNRIYIQHIAFWCTIFLFFFPFVVAAFAFDYFSFSFSFFSYTRRLYLFVARARWLAIFRNNNNFVVGCCCVAIVAF